MTITVEALLPWISLLAAVGAVIAMFAKMRAQVDRSLEKDKEQDAVIERCAIKEDLIKVEKRLEDLALKVNAHGEDIAGLKPVLEGLRQSVDKLTNKIDGLRSIQ